MNPKKMLEHMNLVQMKIKLNNLNGLFTDLISKQATFYFVFIPKLFF